MGNPATKQMVDEGAQASEGLEWSKAKANG